MFGVRGDAWVCQNADSMRGRKTLLTRKIAEDPAGARQQILANMVATSGNISRAAKMMGISRRTLYRYFKQLGLDDAIKTIRDA